jgi:hypothetical protein
LRCVPSTKRPRAIYAVFDERRNAERGLRITGGHARLLLFGGCKVEEARPNQIGQSSVIRG